MKTLDLHILSNNVCSEIGDWPVSAGVVREYRGARDTTIGDAIERYSYLEQQDDVWLPDFRNEPGVGEAVEEIIACYGLDGDDDDDVLTATRITFREMFLRACDDQFGSMVEYAAADYLTECRYYSVIMEDDWDRITDELENITRENTWGDIYDIVDRVIPQKHDNLEDY